MTASLAAVFHGPEQPLELCPIPVPAPQGAEILVRVLGCTLCGSDIHTADGRRGTPLPTILGHEIVGTIEAIGDSAPQHDLAGHPLAKGDRVTWSIAASCGDCFFCNRDLPQKCLTLKKYGHEAFTPGYELLGGLAEHCLLLPGTAVVRVPDEMPLDVACPANCATATVAAAIRAAGDVDGRNVCVFGMGMLGLSASAMLNTSGAASVVGVDIDESRLVRAKTFGATHAIAPASLGDIAKEVTGGHGFDIVLEISGNEKAYQAGWDALRIGGTLVLVGSVFPAPPVGMELEQIVRRNATIRGVHNYAPKDLLAAVNFLAQNHQRFPFADLVDSWYPLDQVADAFEASHDPKRIRVGVGVGGA
jgi:putative phosphonate catabolism associated alcohol dehydrogenase